MTTPTHDQISMEAQKLWQHRGCPVGCDTEIWVEAERKLTEESAAVTFTERASAEMASESEIENLISPAQTEQKSIQAALHVKVARAPQVPHHTGPTAMPAETGKPLWPRAHSS